MSYQKYINYKEQMKVEVCLEVYKNHLWKQINKKINEGVNLKDIVCKEEITSLLKEVSYPHEEIVRISIAADNPVSISKQLEKLKDWNESKKDPKCKKLINLMENLEAGYYVPASEDDIGQSIDAHEEHYKNKIKGLASKIESVAKKIRWRNYDIKLEAVLTEGIGIEEVLVYVEGEKSIIVSIEDLSGKVLDSKYSEACEALIKALKEYNNNKKISTFYVDSSYQNNKLLECKKKEMVLGQRCYLPEGTILSSVKEDKSRWKIKIEENNLLKIEEIYIVGSKEAQIRFIEKI